MARFDRLIGLIFFLGSAGICWESVRLSLGTLHRPGPGFLSFVAGTSLAIFSGIILVRNIKGGGDETFWVAGARRKGVYLTIVLLFFFAFLVDLLGFLVCSILFFLLLGRWVAGLEWKKAAFLALTSSLVAYLVFQVWLKTQLPSGWLV